MTAITTAAQRAEKAGHLRKLEMAAATTIPKGAIVSLNSAGYAINGVDTAATKVVGIAQDTKANAGAAGADEIQVLIGAQHLFATESDLTQAIEGSFVYVKDNNTVGDGGDVTNQIVAGLATRYVSSSQVWVQVGGLAVPSAIKCAAVAGAAAGDVTVTGILATDHLIGVLHLDMGGNAESTLTSEFTITAADTINNAAGTSTASDSLLVFWSTGS